MLQIFLGRFGTLDWHAADKAFDSEEIRDLIDALQYIEHIKSRKDEQEENHRNPFYKARRWVVERTYSWFNRFRKLFINWEKKVAKAEALHHLASTCMIFRIL